MLKFERLIYSIYLSNYRVQFSVYLCASKDINVLAAAPVYTAVIQLSVADDFTGTNCRRRVTHELSANHRREKLIRIQLAAMNLSVLHADAARASRESCCHRAASAEL